MSTDFWTRVLAIVGAGLVGGSVLAQPAAAAATEETRVTRFTLRDLENQRLFVNL